MKRSRSTTPRVFRLPERGKYLGIFLKNKQTIHNDGLNGSNKILLLKHLSFEQKWRERE
jgi:hypothetical protein